MVSPHTYREPDELIPVLASAHDLGPGAGGDGTEGGESRPRPALYEAIRPAIRESWKRSRESGADPGIPAAPRVIAEDMITDVRAGHRLAPHLDDMLMLLRRVTEQTEQLLVITDEHGRALWTEGPSRVRRRADTVGLQEGFCWSEGAVGTNGIGTTLAQGTPQYVYAAEHLASALHGWSCAGAPITDPDTGRVVGCVDVSATVSHLHPATVALVTAAARLTEAQLDLDMRRKDEIIRERYGRHVTAGTGAVLITATGRVVAAERAAWCGRRLEPPRPGAGVTLPDGGRALAEPVGQAYLLRPSAQNTVITVSGAAPERPVLAMTVLGTERPCVWLNGRHIPLTLRHAEILTLLALHPDGMTGEKLALHLYGDEGSPVTVRAEIHRLRGLLGEVLLAKPYRLSCTVDTDFFSVGRLLDDGDVVGAIRLCRGELLPRSDAPAIRVERDELAVRVRQEVLDLGAIEPLWEYANTAPGYADLEVLDRLAAIMPPGDSRRVTVASRRRRLLEEES